MTAICVPVFVKPGVNLEDITEEVEDVFDDLAPRGIRGMIELRCDLATPRLLLEAIEFAHLPTIVTVRPTWEGGLCEKDDEYRAGLWEAAIEAGAEYVDVELATWERNKSVRDRVCEAAEKSGTRIILSNHHFDGRPKDLDQRLTRLRRIKQADIIKLAWMAESILDGIDALKICARIQKEDRKPAVVLAMGEEGLLSRVLAKKFGAAFTFGMIPSLGESAPGQPTVEQLANLFRWDKQTAQTKVFGVAGWPVAHSKSPAIHNAGFDAAGFDGVYVPLPIKPAGAPRRGPANTDDDKPKTPFAAAVEALRNLPDMHFGGMSVTIPHKEVAFKFVCDHNGKIDDLSWRIGVLNTLMWDGAAGDAALRGLNTDYQGALDALAAAFDGRRESLAGKRVAVLGAGGAARAVVAGLVEHGAQVVIYNRTQERADALAEEFNQSANPAAGKAIAAPWQRLAESEADIYINCTPVGMWPKVDESPLAAAPRCWGRETVVFDTVYNPEMTKFLQLAQAQGAKIVKGTEMFIRQAAVQFREFTGKDAPLDAFRAAMT